MAVQSLLSRSSRLLYRGRNKIRSSKAGESYQLLIKLLFSPTLLQILFFTDLQMGQ
jgi:hypothetical protein